MSSSLPSLPLDEAPEAGSPGSAIDVGHQSRTAQYEYRLRELPQTMFASRNTTETPGMQTEGALRNLTGLDGDQGSFDITYLPQSFERSANQKVNLGDLASLRGEHQGTSQGIHLPQSSEFDIMGSKWICSVCNTKLSSKYCLQRHMRMHNKTTFNCTLCDKTYFEQYSLKRHIESAHSGLVYACTFCDNTYKTKSGLSLHLNQHKGMFKYICDICGSGFNYKSAFDGHMNGHTGEKPYRCTLCQKAYQFQCDLFKHKRNCGRKETYSHVCSICGKKFKEDKYLKEHIKGHENPERYTCDKCGKAFAYRAALYQHKKREHEN